MNKTHRKSERVEQYDRERQRKLSSKREVNGLPGWGAEPGCYSCGMEDQ
jgi:hypothetical protein